AQQSKESDEDGPGGSKDRDTPEEGALPLMVIGYRPPSAISRGRLASGLVRATLDVTLIFHLQPICQFRSTGDALLNSDPVLSFSSRAGRWGRVACPGSSGCQGPGASSQADGCGPACRQVTREYVRPQWRAGCVRGCGCTAGDGTRPGDRYQNPEIGDGGPTNLVA
ncbi:hypothetical protein LCGC14_2737000, partial [marine sediment metagenome]